MTKQSDVLPTKRLRTDHPSLASGTGESESFVDLSAQASLQIRTTMGSSSTLSAPIDTAAATTTSSKAKLAADVNPDLAGPSLLEESEGSDDSFYARYSRSYRGAAWQICLGSEVRSHTEHELELKERLNAKYDARGKLLEKKDSKILRLKSQLAEKEAETVGALKVTITQKDHDISLLDSRATHLESALNDAQVACIEAGTKITSLASERDRLASEVSSLTWLVLRIQGEMENFNRKRQLWNCLKSSEYQGILGYALGRAVDFGCKKGLAGRYGDGVGEESSRALLDCFLLDGPLAELPEAASLQPCIEQLSIPIHHAGDKMAVEETSLSFALMNVHARARGPKITLLGSSPTDDRDSLRAPVFLDLGGAKFSSVLGVACIIAMVDHFPWPEACLSFFPRLRHSFVRSISEVFLECWNAYLCWYDSSVLVRKPAYNVLIPYETSSLDCLVEKSQGLLLHIHLVKYLDGLGDHGSWTGVNVIDPYVFLTKEVSSLLEVVFSFNYFHKYVLSGVCKTVDANLADGIRLFVSDLQFVHFSAGGCIGGVELCRGLGGGRSVGRMQLVGSGWRMSDLSISPDSEPSIQDDPSVNKVHGSSNSSGSAMSLSRNLSSKKEKTSSMIKSANIYPLSMSLLLRLLSPLEIAFLHALLQGFEEWQ
ncbi:hypothetical protein Tco_1314044 [Tanacetum coccineum]